MAFSLKKVVVPTVVLVFSVGVLALNNGLARTPPMGWMHWERFRCNINCTLWPNECVNEQLFKEMADQMAEDGYLAAGYEYIAIDDCWMAKTRAPNGNLLPDPDRFPSGMKALADYVHARGLKLGIYADFGLKTCEGYPGSKFYLEMDAKTFAEWGIDMLKMDGCASSTSDMATGYPAMGKFLNMTGRPILFVCSWPAYVGVNNTNLAKVAEACNQWRNYMDSQDSWDVVYNIINFYGKDEANFSSYAGPGQWNDPDELMIGDFGLSYPQQRVMMGMWAIMASPLFMSVDLRHIAGDSKALLLNKRLLAINQDPLGIQGIRLINLNNIQVWRRQITGGYALAFLNGDDQGVRRAIFFTLEGFGLTDDQYLLVEVFEGTTLGIKSAKEELRVNMTPTGIYMMVATPVP